MNYWQQYRAWLIKILKERIYLSRKGYRPDLLTTANELLNLVKFNGYKNNAKLAAFLINKQNQIFQLIPKNRAYENQISAFNMAIHQAQSQQF